MSKRFRVTIRSFSSVPHFRRCRSVSVSIGVRDVIRVPTVDYVVMVTLRFRFGTSKVSVSEMCCLRQGTRETSVVVGMVDMRLCVVVDM